MSTPRLNSIPTSKRGRPRHTKHAAADILGPAIVKALADADLFIVSGAILRELALLVGEPAPEAPPERLTAKELADDGQPITRDEKSANPTNDVS